MIWAALLITAGAQANATAQVRVLPGEPIRFEAPRPASDRLVRETRRRLDPGRDPVILRLIEFQ
jgi:hypothetical protein